MNSFARMYNQLFRVDPKERPSQNVWQHDYERQLTTREIARGEHRERIGGMWDEIGQLQYNFLKAQGLSESNRLLDIGCGSLRGGVHFIRYLDVGNYHGIDMNASLIQAGRDVEVPSAGLTTKNPHLLVDESFDFTKFGASFDFAIAVSVFTHISMNAIQRCLINVADVLKPGGRFYATYFPAPQLHFLKTLLHANQVTTFSDRDPFHYHPSVFQFLTTDLPLSVRNIGVWGHPRGQEMLEFTRVPHQGNQPEPQ